MNASDRITNLINELADWLGKTLARLRKLILEAAPGIIEEWKWSTAVWSHNGNVVAFSSRRFTSKAPFIDRNTNQFGTIVYGPMAMVPLFNLQV